MKLKWTTERRKLSELTRYERNPRLVTDKGKQELNDSVEEFGYAVPLTINTDGTIIGGHQRYEKALADGETEIECTVPERVLTAGEVKRLNVRLNKNIAGTFDYDLLKEDYDLNELYDLGFEEGELKIVIDDEEKEIVETSVAPIVKRGDIFQIGVHRVMCGDSTDAGDVALLMDGEKADMVFTDPPYGVDIGAKNRMLNSFQKAGRNLTDIEGDTNSETKPLYDILLAAFKNVFSVMDDAASFYVTAPQGGELGLMMMMMMMDAGLPARHVLNWVKSSPTFSMGRLDYDYQHEPILYGWKKSHNFYRGGEFDKSVWMIPKPSASKEHPTMKPVALIVNAILNSSQRNENILDVFLGSGSTLVACGKTQRKCYGMEISPHYVEVALRRFAENCSDDNGNVEFQHCNGTLTLDEIVANV